MLAALVELAFLAVPYFVGVCLRHWIEKHEAGERGVSAPKFRNQLLVGGSTFIGVHLTIMFPIASAVLTELDLSNTAASRSVILTFAFFVVQGFLSNDVATAGRSFVRRGTLYRRHSM